MLIFHSLQPDWRRSLLSSALCSSLLVPIAAVTPLCTAQAVVRNPKKGVGAYRHPHVDADLADLNLAWYYDWGPTPKGIQTPAGVQFIPMIWGEQNLNAADEQGAKATGANVLLGFNEPNEKDQANMTVERALAAWPELEALGMRLGSPAVGTGDDLKADGWLARFMAGVKKNHLRVDFICIHPYQSSFDPDVATQSLVREVTRIHKLYHRPVWVTEYAMVIWHGSKGETPSYEKQAEFVTKSSAALDAVPFVERYAWYTTIPNQPTFSAFNEDGSETPVGASLRSAP